MPFADPAPADLVRLAEATLRQPERYQDFFSVISWLLAGARYHAINQAYRQIRDAETWRAFDDCVKAAASRWEGAAMEAERRTLALFAIPLTLVNPSGQSLAGDLGPAMMQALLAGIEHFEVIRQYDQLVLSSRLVSRAQLKCATVAQRHQLTQRICGQVARRGRMPTLSSLSLAGKGQETPVSELYLLGVAGGAHPQDRPLFYQASAEHLLQWTQLCSAQLQIALAAKGGLVEVEAGPPDLIYYALDFGAYRSRLIDMEAQVARQLDRTGMHPAEYLAVISRHPDRCVRISIFDKDAKMQRFLFSWPERPFEDIEMVLQDIALMLQDCGIADIRQIPGMQYAAQGRYGIIPTLEDLEHDRTLQ